VSPADKPPPKAPKPFLGDEELASELDAWDSTFDALHGADESGALPSEPVMDWPTAAAMPAAPAAAPAPGHEVEQEFTLDSGLEDNSTFDRPVPHEAPPPRVSSDTFEMDAGETDFSDVGARGAPAALGEILGGRAETLPPMDDDDEGADDTRIMSSNPAEQEEEVYTSASRPNPSPYDDLSLPEDPIAPPPPPKPLAVPAMPAAPATPRTMSRAIIRRTPLSIPVPKVTPQAGYTVPGSASDFGAEESTKIADLDAMEQRAQESRIAEARNKTPTAPPPVIDEDDYADIEIDAEAASKEEPVPEAIAPRRSTAHVLRRTPAAGVSPARTAADSSPVIEISADDDDGAAEMPVERLASPEDDFSDVAAAVGAHDDLGMVDELLPKRRPSTPRGDSDVHQLGPAPDLDAVIDEQPTGKERPGARAQPEPLRGLPTLLDPGRGDRPPAITDLYPPRVKTPTSVPPLGKIKEAADEAGLDEASQTLLGIQAKPGAGPPKPPPKRVTPPVGTPTSASPRKHARLATPLPDYVTESPDVEPTIDLEAIGTDSPWPEQLQPFPSSQLDEDFATSLLVYEREIATVDDSTASAALRVEAGRLCERLGDTDRARSHYDAALLADPRATAALRGLRRIARSSSDLVEATRQLDAELSVAGALERRPLAHYRIDLLMASGEMDLARVAAGEILDSAPSDVRALLAQLELAFLDGRAEEFGRALEQLAHAITDPELRAAVQSARAMLAAHGNDTAGATTWLAAATDSDPTSLGARLGAIRQAAARNDSDAAATALIDLAHQIETTDPLTTAALCVRAQAWNIGETGAAAGLLATQVVPTDPLVARVAAETVGATSDVVVASAIFAHWAGTDDAPAARAYAAGRAAELDPSRAADLWHLALELDPDDDYGTAQLRTAHVAAESTQLAIAVDLSVAADPTRDRARLRAAFGMIGQGQLDDAIELLLRARTERPRAIALAEALAEALAAAGRWGERAKLLAQLATEPNDQLDRGVAQLRSALAWEEAVGAAAEAADATDLQATTAAALQAWEQVLEHSPRSPAAHAAAIVLASRLGDRDVLAEVLARAQAAERSTWAAASLALRRARLFGAEDPGRADTIFDELPAASRTDDPRILLWRLLAAARRNELGDAAAVLEQRANQLGDTTEVASLRLRSAQLALDGGDAPRATALLEQVERALPDLGVVPDLLTAARRRAGDRPSGPRTRRTTTSTMAASDEFARLVRDADLAAAQNDGSSALALYQQALELRPGDPIAALPLVRVATQLREPAPIAALALAQLRAAEASGDAAAKAEAYELLAQIDKELRDDPGSAQIALESASQADPSRIDLMHRLEREYTVADNVVELLRLRRSELDQVPPDFGLDRAAMIMDTAVLAERDGRPDAELTELYTAALVADPKRRLALLYLESIVRRAGASAELAQLEEQIAAYFEGDARTQAAFYTRAGESLAEIGQIDGAVQRFGKAEDIVPGYVPALAGWRQAALKGQLWIDVAAAATREAAVTNEPIARAKLHHFAGVVLMDKALVNDQAQGAFRQALAADPGHRDAFLRLRILLEEDANHDELAILIVNRLEHEEDPKTRIELHRAAAELHRNFLDARDIAKQHYRAILDADPNDLRAHIAIADIAWEQGSWQEAADALIAHAKLERDPNVLKNLCYRLGMIYADRLVDVPMALKAYQRALTYQPDDENTLVKLADLATQAGEWKLALGACERLVKAETNPDKRAMHLHRVARIFKAGFGDMKRAERALNLALDGAPTNDEALSELVRFYRDAGDMTSVRVHLNRVAGAMRVRVQNDPKDGVAYRVIARTMAARAHAGVDGSLSIARAAAELAQLLGSAAEPEQLLLNETSRVDLTTLLRVEADEMLFPRGVQTELRQIFHKLGDRIAKHVGIDLRAYGVGRGDRLRAKENAIAAHAQDVATGLGFGEIDVYVSARQPYVMISEPTSPVSLVIGSAIAQGDPRGVRFAAGSALKLAQSSLAIPARLAPDDLGVLVVALVRIVQPDFPGVDLDADAVAAQTQKLRRLIPTSLANELKPFAQAIDAQRFHHRELSRDLRVAGLRAGLVASGSLIAGLQILAAQAETDVPSFLADPVAQGLITFALAEDHAAISR
jgi:tetratricopeptide (TPR) repeat protein